MTGEVVPFPGPSVRRREPLVLRLYCVTCDATGLVGPATFVDGRGVTVEQERAALYAAARGAGWAIRSGIVNGRCPNCVGRPSGGAAA